MEFNPWFLHDRVWFLVKLNSTMLSPSWKSPNFWWRVFIWAIIEKDPNLQEWDITKSLPASPTTRTLTLSILAISKTVKSPYSVFQWGKQHRQQVMAICQRQWRLLTSRLRPELFVSENTPRPVKCCNNNSGQRKTLHWSRIPRASRPLQVEC